MPMTDDDPVEALRAEAARISATLVELRKLVGGQGWERRAWTGASAEAVQEARDHLHRYGCFLVPLDDLLDRADELVENGGEPEKLLDDDLDVVITAGTGDPVETVRLTFANLVAAANREEALLRGIVEAQGAAERSVSERLTRIATGLDELRPRWAAAGAPADILTALAHDLEEVTRDASRDPRTADSAGEAGALNRLSRRLTAATEALDTVEGLRSRLMTIDGRLRAAVERLRRYAEKAATEGLGSRVDPNDYAVPAELAGRLAAAIADRPAGGHWQAIGGPERGQATVTEARSLIERIDTARGQLDAGCRGELRGLLEGYRQKAVNDGRGEDIALDALYQAARHALRELDLWPAADAVRAYQRRVNCEPT
jgi:hypothetical protein